LNNESLAELEEKTRKLLEDNVNEIYGCARYFCRTKQDAENLAQEVCVNILKTPPSPNSVGNVHAYLRRCVKNAFIDSERIARSKSNRAEVAIPEGENTKLFGTDDRLDHVSSHMDVRAAIRELNVDDQMLIYLKYYKDYSIAKAVREATGLTGSKAFKRHQTVLDQLRELLAEEAD